MTLPSTPRRAQRLGRGLLLATLVATVSGVFATAALAANAPTAVTTAASSITQSTATLNAAVNPNGEEVSKCEFEYGETIAYGKTAPCAAPPGSGTSPVAVSAAITGLTATTTYHVRISATNAVGTSKGFDETFNTLPELTVAITHVNPFGAQASLCPKKEAEPLADPPCGVDPLTEQEAGDKGETFARESGFNAYTITVKNNSETEPANSGNENVTLEDTLPAGMMIVGPGDGVSAAGWKECTLLPGKAVHGDGELKCVISEELLAGAAYPPITVHLAVGPKTGEPSTNPADPSVNVPTLSRGSVIEKGNAAEEKRLEGEGTTTITEAVPFGIHSTVIEDVNSLREPFAQAGGHPFELTTEIVLNYTTAAPEGALVPARGGAEEVAAELPPGFVGNPLSTPQCTQPVEALKECPSGPGLASTAVGYTHVSVGGEARIEGGVVKPFPKALSSGTSSPIWNLKPQYGSPAELGFVILKGLPFELEAKVRSDGDYGVTVGDSAIGEHPLAFTTTVCANGVHGSNPGFACSAGPASREPFLRNPTECSPSPPSWSVRATPWLEKTDHQTQTVDTSVLTGCSLLQFHPGIEFTPSSAAEGGTTQADEPTGMTLKLNVPQRATQEAGRTVTCKGGGSETPAYEWLRNGVAIEHASSSTYTLTPEDEGKAIQCLVTAKGTEAGSAQTSQLALKTEAPVPPSTGIAAPIAKGLLTVGSTPSGVTLSCATGLWTGVPKFSYQWYRNGVSLGSANGAQTATYTVQEADLATKASFQCAVTATNSEGVATAFSALRNTTPAPTELTTATASVESVSDIGPATPDLKDVKMTLPAGTTVSPSAANGLQACSNAQFGLGTEFGPGSAHSEPAKPASCPLASQIGTVEVQTPLLEQTLQGELFVAEPECSPCTNEDAENGKLYRLFLQIQDPTAGVIVKLHGTTSANTATGQLTTTFQEQPQEPFELLSLKLKGGPGAVLANPQRCGSAETLADLTPWSTPETPDAQPTSSYNVDFNGAGEPCPGALPFAPSFNAEASGANATVAGASPSFSLTFGRHDREQDLSSFTLHMPLGLVGKVPAVKQCGEAEIKAAEDNAGECPAESEIGTATTLAGPGPHPFATTGHAYFTGPYEHAPFGVVVVTLAKAGPFNLGNVVVRSRVTINPYTAAVTVATPKLPQIVDGVPIRLREVHVDITKPGFMLNPTNCNEQHVSAELGGAEGAIAEPSSPFGIKGCRSLPFAPKFTASTQASTSKADGASLSVKITYPQGSYANIAKTFTELPKQLPSRLTTLQKACLDSVFEANPAACPEGSVVGEAIAHTPVLNQPLAGPAYLVSHGGAAFPDLEILLQGENEVKVIIDGQTDIKNGITRSTFNTIPDSPVESFELNLPEGPHSILGANVAPCSTPLSIPTVLTGQNGAVIKQTTPIVVTGCPPTVAITKTKLTGNTLLVTVKTSATGDVKISGKGLKTVTKKNLKAGTHAIRVALTATGRSLRKHHKNVNVRVSLAVGKQAAAKATNVRL